MRWVGACAAGCVCDRCWDQGDECGHNNGTCSMSAIESFRQAQRLGQVATMNEDQE